MSDGNRNQQNGPPTRSFSDFLKARGGRVWIWFKGFAIALVLGVAGMIAAALIFESGGLALLSLLVGGFIGRLYIRHALEQRAVRDAWYQS